MLNVSATRRMVAGRSMNRSHRCSQQAMQVESMTDVACPDEPRLFPIAVGEQAERGVHDHIEGCSACSHRIEQIKIEIESLRHVAQESKLLTPKVETTVPLPAPGAASAGLTIPTAIGRYRIVGLLNEGGQAFVCRGLHPTLAKEVVVKLSKMPLPDSDAERDRLVEEGRILAELDHPNLARVYDLDYHNNRPFVVLEYVRGDNLQRFAEDHRLAWRDVALLVANVADALAVAHAAGVVHQDIKPGNIVVDESGEPSLIDFGMARLRHAWADTAEAPGSVAGTPAYMAPEQARGETEQVGPRSDVFSLGAVLYFLLTGKSPFGSGDSYKSLDRAARCKFDAAALAASGAPQKLQRVCLRAMHAKIDGRYESARAFAEALRRAARRPNIAAATIAIVAAVAFSLAVWFAASRLNRPLPVAPIGPNFSFHVWQDDFSGDLFELVPLQSGDELRIEGKAPRGYQIAVFLIAAEGHVQWLDPAKETTSDAADIYSYPKRGQRAPLQGEPGTEVLIVCGRAKRPIDRAEIEELVAGLSDAGPRWPRLPPDSAVRIDRDRAWLAGSRALGVPIDAPEKPVLDRADALLQRLRERFEYVEGVAFPHQ